MTTYPLGRRAPHPEATHPRLKLGAFLRPEALPPTPPIVDYISKVANWPVFLNDSIGDCTCAAAGHMISAWTAYGQGREVDVTDQDVLKAYEAVSGYDPTTGANDNGAVMQDVLTYWRRTGVGGHKILAFAQLDHTRPAEIVAALSIFGHVYVGLDVPQSAMDQFNAGQPWDVVADDGGILGGHAVDLGYYDSTRALMKVVTWGRPQVMTPAFWKAYVREAWVAADGEWVSTTGTSPEGLNVDALNAAFTEITNGEPGPFPVTPQPGPSPTPTPVPPGPAPGPDPADLALVRAVTGWAKQWHVGTTKRVAQAILTWKKAKGL